MNTDMKYGPQTAEVEALLERISTLTATEVLALGRALQYARDAVWNDEWDAGRNAALGAAWDAGRNAARDAVSNAALGAACGLDEAWGVARDTVLKAALVPGRDAAWVATLALIARDLITPAGFTQAHYDLLTGPWRKVIGKVHPDDAEVL